MNRRGFLGTLLAAAAAEAADPERLLWVPGARKIFVPPARELSVITVGSAAKTRPWIKKGDVITALC